MHYLLQYQISDDYMEKRALYRDAHLSLAWQAVERGELILGGAVGEQVESAQLLFNVNDPKIVEAFAEADPYVINGLVTQYRISPWNTVVGEHASNPVT
ncbi:YciI-like protein [Idiomarina sp. HB]|uniref:YciI-like protein n=1 Tax=Idiomarina sp. HB TaxID=3110479 RepID=UPI003A7FB195